MAMKVWDSCDETKKGNLTLHHIGLAAYPKRIVKNKILNKDAVSFLKSLYDDSIDIAFVDPPYNVGKKYGLGINDNLPDDEFEQLMKNVIKEFRRVTKRGFAFYLDWKQYQKFWNWIPDAEPIIIFKRSSGVVYSPLKIVQHHHVILTTAPAIKKQCKSLWDDIRVMGEGYFFREERFDHPAQTSLKATRRYIEYFTEEGETVLDCFMGVGTTATAAKLEGRNYIGSELNKEFIDRANRRIKNTSRQEELF